MPYKYQSKPQRRFIAGTGERYISSTRKNVIRCHAISPNKLFLLRAYTGNPDITPDQAWPECQCGFPARPGYYVCWLHGAGKKGGPVPGRKIMLQAQNITKYIGKDLADKYRMFAEDPELFNMRQNAALLSARNAELLETATASGLNNDKLLKLLDEAIDLLESGDPQSALKLLNKISATARGTKEAWNEIRSNATVIKDLTNTDLNRVKEMRLWITAEQLMSTVDRLTNAFVEAVTREVIDEKVKGNIMRTVVGTVRDTLGSGGNSLINATSSVVDAE